MKSFHWLLALLFFIPLSASGQVLPFQIYTTRDGLISNSAVALLQDSKGYLWIGSYNGFSIFNGFEFTNYSTSEGFPSGHVGAFAESKQFPGTMWISTIGGGIVQFADGKFLQFKLGSNEQHNQVGALMEDKRGVLWCGTNNGVFQFKNGEFTQFAASDSIGSVLRIEGIGDSLIWIASRDRGVFCYAVRGNDFERINTEHISQALRHRSFLIAKDFQGNLWITDHEQKILQVVGTRIVRIITL
ncbi:MAG: hypothetical protein MN733_29360, partial [Nitrososphaera sp.]|nr:hypothetical protein [Nitrososphaera sp.]